MLSGIKEGLTNYDKRDEANKGADTAPDPVLFKYPRGFVPMTFIFIVFVLILGLGFGLDKQQRINPYDLVMIAFIVAFGLCILWLVARQHFAIQSRFEMSKMGRIITAYRFRKHRSLTMENAARNHVRSLEEYIQFSKQRSKTSRIVFWSNFAFYAVGCLITVVLAVVLNPPQPMPAT